jgi:predicted nucleic acid-binding protein
VADHTAYRTWLESVVNGDEAYGISELVLSGFIRVVTHAKVFNKPIPLAFADQLREPAEQRARGAGRTPLGALLRPVHGNWRERKPCAGRVPCSNGDRIRMRMDHDGQGLQPL